MTPLEPARGAADAQARQPGVDPVRQRKLLPPRSECEPLLDGHDSSGTLGTEESARDGTALGPVTSCQRCRLKCPPVSTKRTRWPRRAALTMICWRFVGRPACQSWRDTQTMEKPVSIMRPSPRARARRRRASRRPPTTRRSAPASACPPLAHLALGGRGRLEARRWRSPASRRAGRDEEGGAGGCGDGGGAGRSVVTTGSPPPSPR